MADGPARPSRGEHLAALGLLAIFAVLAVLSMRDKNPTFDETAHLAAGLSYVQTGDFRMNPEHPALPKLLAGAAASLTGVKVRAEGTAWDTSEQWDFGRETLYEGNVPWRRIVLAGRVPMVLLGVLLGLVLWTWLRAMLGATPALAALALYVFCPNVLAHTRLVTTDVPLTLFVTATTAALWQAWRSGRARWIVAAAVGIALTMVTKFSAFSYAPVWALLALLPGERRTFRQGLAHLGLLAGLAIVLTEAFVFVCYGLATDFATIRSLGMTGRGVSPADMSLLRRIPYEIMASVPWPSAEFARGLKDVILYTESGHPVYAMGLRGDRGWWWQSFLALAVKVPLPALVLGAWGIVSIARRPALRTRALWFFAAPAGLVLGTNVAAHLGLGVRHLLPMFPFLVAAAVVPLSAAGAGGFGRLAVVATLLLWQAGETLAAHPHYLPYFNEAARVVGGGYRLLGDSNLDWGQDLSRAARRVRDRGANEAILCYFGTANPFVEGMKWQLLPPASRGKKQDPWTVLPTEGPQWLVMSATNRQGVYYRANGNEAPYPWLDDVPPDEIVGHGSMFLYEISTKPEVQRGLYATYQRHGLRQEAEAAQRRVVDLVPHDGEARTRLVDLQLARGDLMAAERTMSASPNPDVPMLLRHVVTRQELGMDVHESFQRARAIFPKSAEIKNSYAWFLQKHDESLEEALRLADEAVAWDGEDIYYRDTRGMVWLKLGDAWAALEDLDYALAQPDGDLPEIRWHRVLALAQAGRADDAQAEARRLETRADTSDDLRAEIATFLAGARR